MLIAFHKPYGVVSQFTPDRARGKTLAAFGFPPRVYPIGRLDADSEGLLLLSDEPELNERLLHPRRGHAREYWCEVERVPSPESLAKLSAGVVIQGQKTLRCAVRPVDPRPDIAARVPPIRTRLSVPTSWISIELTEGKNRQVRRMTAAIGHPTLRLIRVRIGRFRFDGVAPGAWRPLNDRERALVLATD